MREPQIGLYRYHAFFNSDTISDVRGTSLSYAMYLLRLHQEWYTEKSVRFPSSAHLMIRREDLPGTVVYSRLIA